MSQTMSDQEAVNMMERCKDEIRRMRAEIASLRPKAEAYEDISRILQLIPRGSGGASEDLTWVLQKRIDELKRDIQSRHDAVERATAETAMKEAE